MDMGKDVKEKESTFLGPPPVSDPHQNAIGSSLTHNTSFHQASWYLFSSFFCVMLSTN